MTFIVADAKQETPMSIFISSKLRIANDAAAGVRKRKPAA
jgi:hypothetical protein